jgi:hypothetical protein
MNVAVVNGAGNPAARVQADRGWTRWFIGACVGLFAAATLLGQQAQFQGSVPTGVASATPLPLTLRGAIDRGLRANLGVLLSGQASESSRGERLRSLSALLVETLAYIDIFLVLTVAASIMFLLAFIVRKNDPKASGAMAVG